MRSLTAHYQLLISDISQYSAPAIFSANNIACRLVMLRTEYLAISYIISFSARILTTKLICKYPEERQETKTYRHQEITVRVVGVVHCTVLHPHTALLPSVTVSQCHNVTVSQSTFLINRHKTQGLQTRTR